jgi:hypothetical protein
MLTVRFRKTSDIERIDENTHWHSNCFICSSGSLNPGAKKYVDRESVKHRKEMTMNNLLLAITSASVLLIVANSQADCTAPEHDCFCPVETPWGFVRATAVERSAGERFRITVDSVEMDPSNEVDPPVEVGEEFDVSRFGVNGGPISPGDQMLLYVLAEPGAGASLSDPLLLSGDTIPCHGTGIALTVDELQSSIDLGRPPDGNCQDNLIKRPEFTAFYENTDCDDTIEQDGCQMTPTRTGPSFLSFLIKLFFSFR